MFEAFRGQGRFIQKKGVLHGFVFVKVPKYLPKVKGAMTSLHESGFKSCGLQVWQVSARSNAANH